MLEKSLQKIIRLLEKIGIPYMVIGGYATIYHGHARFTEDIDIVLGVDVEAFDEILRAVKSEFAARPENPRRFAQQTNVLPLIEKESEIRIDLMFSFLEFERQAIGRAITASVGDFKVNVIQADDLIIYKMLAGRARDLDDVKFLYNRKKDELNQQKIENTLQELSVLMDDDDIIKNWQKIK